MRGTIPPPSSSATASKAVRQNRENPPKCGFSLASCPDGTAKEVSGAKPGPEPFKLYGGYSLYMLVEPSRREVLALEPG
jgi:hypothetical protein